ncbi:MAG: type I-E CRISPR-associated protein Cse2/CasB [Chloroflexota bacterium]|nr:type I-E CRISPR-associated protein Cse2/CasB [Chloroflexota bacterium]
MTTEVLTETPAQSRPWGEVAVSFARQLAADDFQRGDLAELRRMDPDKPDAAAFWRLMAQQDLLDRPAIEHKWALVLHGLALMTRTAEGDAVSRSAHDRNTPIGEALFYGDDRSRQTAFYSHTRLNRLLVARGPMLRVLLARLFRMLGAKGCAFDWYRMARLILNEERADDVRRDIARRYYWAENRASRPQD